MVLFAVMNHQIADLVNIGDHSTCYRALMAMLLVSDKSQSHFLRLINHDVLLPVYEIG